VYQIGIVSFCHICADVSHGYFSTSAEMSWVCYHDNSKLCVSILTKLGLLVRWVTISSWLNFGLRRGKIFWLHLTTASAVYASPL